jgi:hypothetical protein
MVHTINCDQCGHEIDIEQTLGKKITGELNVQYKSRYQNKEIELNKKSQSIAEREQALENADKKQKERIDSIVKRSEQAFKAQAAEDQKKKDAVIESQIKEREQAFRQSIQKEMERDYKTEMEEAANKNVENNKLKAEKMKLEATLNTIESLHKSDTDVKVIEARNEANKKSNEEKELLQQEHEEKMKQMKKSMEDVRRQADQGSMQIQGEAQENSIEDFLKYTFPVDVIEPIKQGALGADCLQYVKTDNNQSCGIIYYESKRTKEFQPAWIEKFKADMRAKNVDVGVLVTKAMPKGMEQAGLVKGVWVCSLEEFKTISHILRKQLVEIHKVRNISENRQDIASLLYKYLTSSEFKMDMEVIVEGFTDMKSDIDSEKRAMNRAWSKREKHLEKIMLSTVNMYGSLQGISDNSIETINGLELPGAVYELIEEKK